MYILSLTDKTFTKPIQTDYDFNLLHTKLSTPKLFKRGQSQTRLKETHESFNTLIILTYLAESRKFLE